jgi:hypothetical protein
MMAPWSLRWYAFLSFTSLSEMLELTLILNPLVMVYDVLRVYDRGSHLRYRQEIH